MMPDMAHYHRCRRANAIAMGRCSSCQVPESKPVPGKVNCQGCLDYNKHQRKLARDEAVRLGMCGKCLKREAREGRRSCQKCADELKVQPVRLEAVNGWRCPGER